LISRLTRRPALHPPKGEEKEKREAVEPGGHPAGTIAQTVNRTKDLPVGITVSAKIESRAVFRIVVVAIVAIALAALLGLIVIETRTTIRWAITATFLALALAPAVSLLERVSIAGRHAPRWLAIALTFLIAFAVLVLLVLHVIPPMIEEVEQVGQLGPQYVQDAQRWAHDSDQFRSLDQEFHLTATLHEQAQALPDKLSDAAGALESFTVGLLKHVVSAITVIVLAFFILLEGPKLLDNSLRWLGGERERRGREIADGIYGVVKSYVTVNLSLALAAGAFTWVVLEILGVDLAVPLAILVALMNLVPLVGFTIGGILVALVAALHSFPVALIVWAVLFLIYQQLQDRVIQPLLYGKTVQINPLIAIVALFAGAQIAGVLGALLAIPVAASIGVVANVLRSEWDPAWRKRREAAAATPTKPASS
jgi:predicted PurR-regulated permease PerM